VIEQATRCRDYDIHPIQQRPGLRLDANSAEDWDDAQVGVLAVLPEALLHLRGELSRRSQDQNANAVNGLAVLGGERSADQIVNDG
jgi:hypothetical protein